MNTLAFLFFPALMLVAAFSDLFTMRISNRLVLLLAAGFLVLALLAGMSWPLFGLHVLAAFMVLALTFGLFAAGWIGGGDAKFAAATVLWLGFEAVLPYLLYASVFGGLLTLAILIARRYMLPVQLLQVGWIERLHNRETGIPYGIALALSGLVVYGDTVIARAFAA